MKKGILIVLLTIFFLSPQASAGDKGKGRPHGWSKGEKKGWNTDVPPGLEKKGLSAPQDLSEDGQGKEEDMFPESKEEEMTKKKKWKKKKDSDEAEENGEGAEEQEEADEDDDDDEEDKEGKDQKLKQKKGKGNEQKKRGRTQKGE